MQLEYPKISSIIMPNIVLYKKGMFNSSREEKDRIIIICMFYKSLNGGIDFHGKIYREIQYF